MNVAIVYYSYSGNTDQAAEIIQGVFESQGHSVTRLRIKGNEADAFFMQCFRAVTRQVTRIDSVETDLSKYDLILFATPVWAMEMVPAMRTYLDRVSGLSTKKVILFVTYGSGFGKDHCLDTLERAIAVRGAKCIARFSISQFKVGNKAWIEELLKDSLRPLGG